jgi:hypothetical protein
VEKTAQQGALCFELLTKYYSGDQVKNVRGGGGGACGTYWGKESRGAYRVLGGKLEGGYC